MQDIVNGAREKMQKTYALLQQDFATVRSGKPSPTLVENIVISAYNGTTKLRVLELASIHIQPPATIVITPFDKSVIMDIQKGIADSNVGLNPIVDNDFLRINLPPLTEERRKDFVRLIHQKSENGRVMVRQVRHEAMEDIKKKGESSVSEDEVIRVEKEVQRLTDEFMDKIDHLKADKEKELMTL